jgi:hypothetical protein
MFEQVFESLKKSTESTVQMQQEMFKKWVSLWPGTPPTPPAWTPQFEQFQKKWKEVVAELQKRQKEAVEANLKTGLENIEKAFQIGEAKNTEDLRVRVIELWKKCFESAQKIYEAQVRDFQTAMEKWAELFAATT